MPTKAATKTKPAPSRGIATKAALAGAAVVTIAGSGIVQAPPASAYATGCGFGYRNPPGSTNQVTDATTCLEVWGDGTRVDNMEQWFNIGSFLPGYDAHFQGDIYFEMNFDYKDGNGNVYHTDTITTPTYHVDCSQAIMGICAPNDKGPYMYGGKFRWGAYRPDITGNVGYRQVCGLVRRKDGVNVTNYKCFDIG
jgi:hypothetical protein